MKQKKQSWVFAGLLNDDQFDHVGGTVYDPGPMARMGLEKSTYNFATGIWTSLDGNRKYKNGERVE